MVALGAFLFVKSCCKAVKAGFCIFDAMGSGAGSADGGGFVFEGGLDGICWLLERAWRDMAMLGRVVDVFRFCSRFPVVLLELRLVAIVSSELKTPDVDEGPEAIGKADPRTSTITPEASSTVVRGIVVGEALVSRSFSRRTEENLWVARRS